jgi:hypothetical protein
VPACRPTWGGVVAVALLALAVPTANAVDWAKGGTGKGTARWAEQDGRLVYRGGADFGWAVVGDRLRDGFVEVRFHPVDGKKDRAGGVVWRWRDAKNYYVARGNALENNVVAYKMVDGRRTDLKPVGASVRAYGVKADVPPLTWHTLRVDFNGPEFLVKLNGRDLFTVRDQTFTEEGAVGIWSKADSLTEFDGFRYGSGGQEVPDPRKQ